MTTTKLLMSAGNPNGFKLEEVLATIADDLEVKNSYLAGKGNDRTAMDIHTNNTRIIARLRAAVEIQNQTMALLDTIRPDDGPTNPRI